jgi:hypothetical protein
MASSRRTSTGSAAGIEQAGRPEKLAIKLPAGVRLDDAPNGTTVSRLLEAGEIDGFIAPRPPTLVEKGHPNIGGLFRDPVAAAKDYYKRTGLFPIMHVVGVRRTLAEKHPWLPGAVFKAFERAKAIGLEKLSDTSATKVTLPFVEEALTTARADGRGFLVLRGGEEPQGARLFPRATSRAGAIVAAGVGERAVSSGNVRDV